MIVTDGAYKTQISEGMRIEWDVPIPLDDGIVLQCDVFRPLDDEPHLVIMSYGPYGKLLHFRDGFAPQWERFEKAYPEVLCNSSNRYQNFEVNDPERFVPDGYRPRRLTWNGTISRISRYLVSKGSAGFLSLH